jgi:hypothetical protein
MSLAKTETMNSRRISLIRASILVVSVVTTSVTAFVVGPTPSHRAISSKRTRYEQPSLSSSSQLFWNKKLNAANRDSIDATKPTNESTENFPNGKEFQRSLAGLVVGVTIAVASIGGAPLKANAGFGPSSGATTTPPPNLNSIKTTAAKTSPELAPTENFNVDLDGKKLKILIDSALNVKRLEEFSGQLDTVIDSLKDSISSSLTFGDDDDSSKYDAENPYIESQREAAKARAQARERELLQAQTLQEQIQNQEKMLLKLQNQPYWFNYFAAFVGATVSTLVMHPLDTIKTRLQVGAGTDDDIDDDPWQGESLSSNSFPHDQPGAALFLETSGAGGAVVTAEMVTVMNTTTSATATAISTSMDTQQVGVATAIESVSGKSEDLGVFDNLYEGLTGNLFKEVPPSAVYLGVYETVKYALSPMVPPAFLLWVYLIAGAAGETVGSFIRAPAEAVKSLVQSKAKDNALEAAKSVLGTEEGRANVIRAWSASIIRDVPFGGIQLAVFETIKAAILNNPSIEFDSSTLLSEAIIGAFAGGVGALITNPADVITTRIITQDLTSDDDEDNPLSDGSSGQPLGALQMASKIYEEEGFGAFFSGWAPRVGYWAPAIGIFLSCYCSVRQAGISYDLFP